jgi:hypothetical protein
MAIAVGNTGSIESSNTNTLTLSHTIASGSDRILVAVFANYDSFSAGDREMNDVTFNSSESFTKALSFTGTASTITEDYTVEVWYLVNPSVTTANVVANNVSGSNATEMSMYLADFTGAEQSSPVGNTGTGDVASGSPSATVNSVTNGSLVIGGFYSNQSVGDRITSNDTGIAILDHGIDVSGAAYLIAPSAGNQTLDWTDTDNDEDVVTGAVEFYAAGGAVDTTVADATHSHTADLPSITQTHAISTNEATHSHTADSPTITQTHQIAVDDSTHAHTADESTVDQTVPITSQDSTHAHSAESPTITQTHEISVDDSTHGHTADSPSITQTHLISVDDSSHSHTAGTSTITSAIEIVPQDATHSHTAGSPNLTIVATYYFDGSDVAATDEGSDWANVTNADDGNTATDATLTSISGTPSVLKIQGTNAPSSGETITQVRSRVYGFWGGQITLIQIHTDTEAELLDSYGAQATEGWTSYQVLDTPTAGWTWATLQALEFQTAFSSITGSWNGQISAVEIEVTSQSGTTQITAQESSHSHTADSPTITQTHQIDSLDATHSHTTDQPTITQTHEIAVADATHSHTSDEPAITQAQNIVVADSAHAHAVDSPSITQTHEVVANDAVHSHSAEEPTITQTHEISVDEATHSHTAENITITQTVPISVDDATHAHATDSPVITQTHQISVNESTHTQTADEPTVTQTHEIVTQDATHGHSADNVTVTINSIAITAQSAIHNHSADEPIITETHLIATDEATHGHSADSPTITQTHNISVDDALHSHTGDNVEVTVIGDIEIIVQDAHHSQVANNVVIEVPSKIIGTTLVGVFPRGSTVTGTASPSTETRSDASGSSIITGARLDETTALIGAREADTSIVGTKP